MKFIGIIMFKICSMAPHFSTLAWKIPRTEEPGRLQSMGSLTVGHDWVTSLSLFTFHFHALEKEMATPSSVLAWRIPGTGESGGLPSLGSHRVRHDWSDLAATGKCQFVVDSPNKLTSSWHSTQICKGAFLPPIGYNRSDLAQEPVRKVEVLRGCPVTTGQASLCPPPHSLPSLVRYFHPQVQLQ